MKVNRDPNHVHTYDEHGHITCCTLEDKINEAAETDHDHGTKSDSNLKLFLSAVISFALLNTSKLQN